MGKVGHLQPPVSGRATLWSALGNNILFGAKLLVKCQQKVQLKDRNTRKGKRHGSKGRHLQRTM